MTRKLCVTGGIACGKSSVGEILGRSGVSVIEADDVCHRMLEKGGALVGQVGDLFGDAVLDRDGGIDRRALAKIIFANGAQRAKLNALVHPRARRAIDAWLRRLGNGTGKIAAAVVPLAYEARWDRAWDAMVCVAAPQSLQIGRLKKKGLSEKEGKARIAAQMSLSAKMQKADYVIFNAGTKAGLRKQTELMLRSVREKMERCYGRKK